MTLYLTNQKVRKIVYRAEPWRRSSILIAAIYYLQKSWDVSQVVSDTKGKTWPSSAGRGPRKPEGNVNVF